MSPTSRGLLGLDVPGTTPEPAAAPQLGPLWRALAAFAGVATGAAMLLVGGLYALFSSCTDYDGHTNVCGAVGGLVEPLELVAVFGGAAAALAGGVGTAIDGRARWIVAGLGIVAVLALVLMLIVGVQQPALN